MGKVILGYPGVGIKSWIAGAAEPDRVLWQDELDLVGAITLPPEVTYVCAELTLGNLDACVEAKVSTILVYPAPTAMGEYPVRWAGESKSEEQVAELLATSDGDLRTVREDASLRTTHIVLGRGENASAFLEAI